MTHLTLPNKNFKLHDGIHTLKVTISESAYYLSEDKTLKMELPSPPDGIPHFEVHGEIRVPEIPAKKFILNEGPVNWKMNHEFRSNVFCPSVISENIVHLDIQVGVCFNGLDLRNLFHLRYLLLSLHLLRHPRASPDVFFRFLSLKGARGSRWLSSQNLVVVMLPNPSILEHLSLTNVYPDAMPNADRLTTFQYYPQHNQLPRGFSGFPSSLTSLSLGCPGHYPELLSSINTLTQLQSLELVTWRFGFQTVENSCSARDIFNKLTTLKNLKHLGLSGSMYLEKKTDSTTPLVYPFPKLTSLTLDFHPFSEQPGKAGGLVNIIISQVTKIIFEGIPKITHLKIAGDLDGNFQFLLQEAPTTLKSLIVEPPFSMQTFGRYIP